MKENLFHYLSFYYTTNSNKNKNKISIFVSYFISLFIINLNIFYKERKKKIELLSTYFMDKVF